MTTAAGAERAPASVETPACVLRSQHHAYARVVPCLREADIGATSSVVSRRGFVGALDRLSAGLKLEDAELLFDLYARLAPRLRGLPTIRPIRFHVLRLHRFDVHSNDSVEYARVISKVIPVR